MNSQLQCRTAHMLRHVCPSCAMLELYYSGLSLPSLSANAQKRFRCYKHIAEELSEHPYRWPAGHQRQLKPFQLP